MLIALMHHRADRLWRCWIVIGTRRYCDWSDLENSSSLVCDDAK